MSKKRRRQVALSDEARSKLVQWGEDNHIAGGLSGAIEYLAFNLNNAYSNKQEKLKEIKDHAQL